jgi:hypothetical protein
MSNPGAATHHPNRDPHPNKGNKFNEVDVVATEIFGSVGVAAPPQQRTT